MKERSLHLQSTIHYPLSTIHYPLSAIRYPLSTIAVGWGPGQRPDLALEAFRRRIEAGHPVIINGDGSQRRDLTHVADVARAVELALRWRGPGAVVLNVGTGRNHSVMDMLAAATSWDSGSRIKDRR